MSATDPMGLAAIRAAVALMGLDFQLLGAASLGLPRQRRREHLERAFCQWHGLCRAMSDLQHEAQTSAAAGYERADRLRSIAEGGI